MKTLREGDRVGVPWLHNRLRPIADPNYVGHLPGNVPFPEIAPVLCAGVTVYTCQATPILTS